MMDSRTRISNAQSVTTDALSESSLNLGAVNKEIGINQLVLHVVVTTAFTGLDSGLTIYIVDGSGVDGNGRINAGETVVAATAVLAQAGFLSGGKRHFQLAVPPGKRQQYLAARYTPANEAGVGGAFTAWFDEQPESEVTS